MPLAGAGVTKTAPVEPAPTGYLYNREADRERSIVCGRFPTSSTEQCMHPFPHQYVVTATLRSSNGATLSRASLPELRSAPPEEFGGPGDQWSPEALLTAAVADCFALNFGAIAAASKFEWKSLAASTTGKLDRLEGKMRFVRFDTHVQLTVSPSANTERARMLLEKAEATCPISNSLNCERHLQIDIRVSE